jgi:hypothetical protein
MLPGGADYNRAGHQRKKLILCFDGTGNKFKGNSGDTNILKIFRMLDRSGGEQCKPRALGLLSVVMSDWTNIGAQFITTNVCDHNSPTCE